MTEEHETSRNGHIDHADCLDAIIDHAVGLHLAIVGSFEGRRCEDRAALARMSYDLFDNLEGAREKFGAIIDGKNVEAQP